MEDKIKALPFMAQWSPPLQMPAVGVSGIVGVSAGAAHSIGMAGG